MLSHSCILAPRSASIWHCRFSFVSANSFVKSSIWFWRWSLSLSLCSLSFSSSDLNWPISYPYCCRSRLSCASLSRISFDNWAKFWRKQLKIQKKFKKCLPTWTFCCETAKKNLENFQILSFLEFACFVCHWHDNFLIIFYFSIVFTFLLNLLVHAKD